MGDKKKRRRSFSSLITHHSSPALLVVRDAYEVGAVGESFALVAQAGVGHELRDGLVELFGAARVVALLFVVVQEFLCVRDDLLAAAARGAVASEGGLLRLVRVVLVVAVRVVRLLAHLVGDLAEVYEVVGHVY